MNKYTKRQMIQIGVGSPIYPIYVPFDYEFNNLVKENCPGAWFNGFDSAWMVRAEHREIAREIMMYIYGSDGERFDQVDVHISVAPGQKLESLKGEALYFPFRRLARLSMYKLELGIGVEICVGNSFRRKVEVGDWRVGIEAPIDAPGHIILRAMSRRRGEELQELYTSGNWPEELAAVADVRLEPAIRETSG